MRTFKLSEILLGLLVHSIVKCMPVRPCPLSWHAAPRHSHMMRNVSGEEKFFYCENRNNDCDYGNNVSQEEKSECINLFQTQHQQRHQQCVFCTFSDYSRIQTVFSPSLLSDFSFLCYFFLPYTQFLLSFISIQHFEKKKM